MVKSVKHEYEKKKYVKIVQEKNIKKHICAAELCVSGKEGNLDLIPFNSF
jgi:hypothetical protein